MDAIEMKNKLGQAINEAPKGARKRAYDYLGISPTAFDYYRNRTKDKGLIMKAFDAILRGTKEIIEENNEKLKIIEKIIKEVA